MSQLGVERNICTFAPSHFFEFDMVKFTQHFIGLVFLSVFTHALSQNNEAALIDSLKSDNLIHTNIESIVNNYNTIAFHFGSINIDSSLFYSKKALALAKKNQISNAVALSNSYIARALVEKGHFKSSIYHYTQALKLYTEANDSVNLLDCYRGMAYVYSFVGNSIKGLEYNFKILEIAQTINDSASLSIAYNNIASNYTKLDNYELANYYFQKSLALDLRLNQPQDIIVSYANLTVLNIDANKLDEALSYYKKLNSLIEKINSNYIKALMYIAMAKYNIATLQTDSANFYLKKANLICNQSNYPQLKHRVLLQKGQLLYNEKQYSNCILHLDSCLLLSQQYNINENLPQTHLLRAEAFAALKHYEPAYESMQQAKMATDSLKNKKIASLLGEFEKDQKSKIEFEKIRLRAKLKDQQISYASTQIRHKLTLALITIVLLLTTISIASYFLLRIKKSKQALQAQHLVINQQKQLLEENIAKVELSEKELKKMNAGKDKFFSIIAHDLKSPFSAILGFSEELMNNYDTYSDDDRKTMINILGKSAKSTFLLLENLLTWARSQSGRIVIEQEALTLKNLVNTSISAYYGAANRKNIQTECIIPNEITVWADCETLKITVSNLYSNAIKFSHPNGKISINTSIANNYCTLCIADEGIGMSTEIMNNLFTMEQNVKRQGTNKEKGTGLGLMLCYEFIRKNGGDIWVKSTEGKGSTFYISIPLYTEA